MNTYEIAELAHRAVYLVEAGMIAEDEAELEAINAEMLALLDDFDAEAPGKLDALRAVHLRLKTLEKEARDESKRIADRARAFASQAERVKGLAETLLAARRGVYGDDYKVRTATASYSLRKSAPALVGPEDASQWPEHWQRVEVKPDKRTALAAMKKINPEQWPDGFSLEQRESVSWR